MSTPTGTTLWRPNQYFARLKDYYRSGKRASLVDNELNSTRVRCTIVHQPSDHAYRSEKTFNSRVDYAAIRGNVREYVEFDGALCYGT
jgi:hypothetical protein